MPQREALSQTVTRVTNALSYFTTCAKGVSLFLDLILRLLGAVLAAMIVGTFIPALRPYFGRWFDRLKTRWGLRFNGDKLVQVLEDQKGTWLVEPINPANGWEQHHNSLKAGPRVLTIANLKGGVGKTTIAVNLAAIFAERAAKKNKHVLALDLDFQGSMSSMLLSEEQLSEALESESLASALIRGKTDQQTSGWFVGEAKLLQSIPQSYCIPAHYDLARTENEMQLRWMAGLDQADIRFKLSELLHSTTFQNQYQKVIIDAPPRLTTGAIQAFCSSNHVLIPTKLDRLSINGVAAFLNQIEEHRALFPQLRVLGVIGTMTGPIDPVAPNQRARDRFKLQHERDGYTYLERVLELHNAKHPGHRVDILPIDRFIPLNAAISRSAGIRPAALSDANSGRMFDALADEIERRMAP